MEKHKIDKLFENAFVEFVSTPNANLWERIETQIPQSSSKKTHKKRFIWLLLSLLFLAISWVSYRYSHEELLAGSHKPKKAEYVASIPTHTNMDTQENDKKFDVNAATKHHLEPTTVLEKKIGSETPNLPPAEEKSIELIQKEEKKMTEVEIKKDSISQSISSKPLKDTLQKSQTPKGTKIIIKLSEPEPSQEGKARDFAATKTGKFLRKLKKIKNGESKIPKLHIALN
ncbi:MAG: hypothetical protein SFU27_13035 [Thermonemataceae bacterium]|nr:hypothetical protein [Thermonemataceae bacterium]